MKIYTKTGDQGKTSLFNGERVLKDNDLVSTYGTIDELGSFLGMVYSKISDKKDKDFFLTIEKDLYLIMAYLSKAKVSLSFLDKRVKEFEKKIDELTLQLPPIKKFIIPTGSELTCWFHILRTVCRKAERLIVKVKQYQLVPYFNRLSDLFFVYARFYNKEKEIFS